MPATTVKSEATDQHNNCDNEEEEPKDMKNAHLIINELRNRCRNQSEQIMAWKKAFSLQQEQNHRLQKEKTEQLNYLTSQLLLLESRIMRKQKQVSNVIYQRELTIYRQQKIIETLSSRLIDHGIMDVGMDAPMHTGSNSNDFDSLNDSDSAVVLEDVDSDCNSSIYFGGGSISGGGSLKSRCGSNKMTNDVTIVRSISDAIETNLKYNNTRRSNCFLRRPEILETVYSVEEDPEPQNAQAQAGANTGSAPGSGSTTGPTSPKPDAVSEKRDKFKNRTEKCISTDQPEGGRQEGAPVIITSSSCDVESVLCETPSQGCKVQGAVTNFNRVMSNHRSVTKPKDVKYKRINKAKSKSLEELRGRLKHWVERGTCNVNLTLDPTGGSHLSGHLSEHCGAGSLQQSQTQQQPNLAQSYA
ncbi:uncharacterized protein LOC126564769 [Anopheles maculipalpis]|uniref:uncharacterized protein LOC126564769 n=1 Tax=Anopheles maculipalpis TaxID=1496333 RepID=UPI002158D23D|nr:uncharacterized protein LOC126564769 [Anopheles maculipalpis]